MEMSAESKKAILRDRIKKMENNPKDIKCPGVLRALRREERKL